jgi:pyrroloquinoline quinone (PQQ) biosynthesis protein C
MTQTVDGAPDIDAFIDDLQRELRQRRLSLLDADFLTAVEAGTVSREQISTWAQTFYAATRNGRVSLGNFYANSPDDPELRRELAANLYEEETGRLSGVGKCHMDVFADLLAAFRVTPQQAAAVDVPTGGSQPQGRPIPPDEFFVELAAYGFSVEAPNAEFCTRLARALRDRYQFDDAELTWFTMHAALDADHGAEFQKYVVQAAEQPDGLARLRQLTLERSASTQIVWDGFGRWRSGGTSAAAVEPR